MKKIVLYALILSMSITPLFVGCGKDSEDKDRNTSSNSNVESEKKECPLEDGVYIAEFNTDSSMFHVNEAHEGKGVLTVKDGEMTIHISLVSKKILNLFAGVKEDAEKEDAKIIEPTIDTVTYNDGTSEEVFGFDVPVPGIDVEFDCALIGEKGVWYDHKVVVSNPVLSEEATDSTEGVGAEQLDVEDGTYHTNVVLEGGSGRATVESPCEIRIADGKCTAVIVWSSQNYDFMMIGDTEYLPVNTEGNSVFEIPVSVFDAKMEVQADTVAMSKPHLIDYTLTFDSNLDK